MENANGMPFLSQNLGVTIQRFSMVHPIEKTDNKSMFLSNIDQALNFDIEKIHFFQGNVNYTPEKVFEKIEVALGRLLVPYDFLAGRLKFDDSKGRYEVDCNSKGVGLALASCESTLNDLGSLVFPNPAFRQLIQEKQWSSLKLEDVPIFFLQVTSFKCGGFAIGISHNHILMDGISFKMFLQNLAFIVAEKPMAIVPFNDRRLLAARLPPRITFSHPELLEIPGIEVLHQNAGHFQITPEELDTKVLNISGKNIMKLKTKAISGTKMAFNIKITSFNVVMAHIWRCKALSKALDKNDLQKISTILYAVDIRSRLGPPLFPASYTGNAIISAYGAAKIYDLKEKPFSYLVRMIAEGTNRVTDEYIRSTIDWGSLHKGVPNGDVLVSSWWKLGFDEVEYPWGRPKYSCPLVYRKDIILLLPETDGVTDKGVNVFVALPKPEMKLFQDHFTRFLDIA